MTQTLKPDFLYVLDQFDSVTGQRPAIQTACRLIKARQLNAKKILGRWMCTREDVMAYIERETEAAMEGRLPKQVAAKTRSAAKRARDIAAAEALLEADGIV